MILAVDISFWCSAIAEPWSWTPRLYPGVWLAVAALAIPYGVAVWRRRRATGEFDAKAARRYGGGIVAFWLATDWPIGLLGASYLASAHMLQFLLYVLVAAPLLLTGMPEWMARRLLSRIRGYRMVGFAAGLFAAGMIYNVVLATTHAPIVTDTFRGTQAGSFVMDVVWLASGIVLWLPIASPLPEHRAHSYGAKMAYLFLAATIVPVLPASFLVFADFPLYSTFELAPRVFSLTAGEDQALAGALMKVASIPIIWGTLLLMMVKWANVEGAPGLGPERVAPSTPVRSTPGDAGA